jgi:hypothetical protein
MKGDLLIGARDESMVGDGHAMRVPTQILEHTLRATEGRYSHIRSQAKQAAIRALEGRANLDMTGHRNGHSPLG